MYRQQIKNKLRTMVLEYMGTFDQNANLHFEAFRDLIGALKNKCANVKYDKETLEFIDFERTATIPVKLKYMGFTMTVNVLLTSLGSEAMPTRWAVYNMGVNIK